jgi:hypothetical protein
MAYLAEVLSDQQWVNSLLTSSDSEQIRLLLG